ncbi:MAG: NADH-quinone oxidoreductase subunit C [Patescibacteria group bacterium]
MKKFDILWNEERPKKYYSEVIGSGVLNVVKRLYKGKARFITATAFENPGQLYVYYHFEINPVRNRPARGTATAAWGRPVSNGVNKALYTLKTALKGETTESIASVYPTASWVEREMAELYSVKFQTKNTKYKTQKSLLLTPDIKTPFREES